MHFKDQIHQVTEWHSKIIKLNYHPDFMEFLNEYVTNYFRAFKSFEPSLFTISYKGFELKVTLLNYSFVARSEGSNINFYKGPSYDTTTKIGIYQSNSSFHTLFDMTVRQFHPDYIDMLLEDAFSGVKETHSKIIQRQFWL